MPVSQDNAVDTALKALAAGQNRDPFAVLGAHREAAAGTTARVIIRTIQPAARLVELRLLSTGETLPMTRRNGVIYEAAVATTGSELPDYRLRVTFPGDHVVEVDDPYRYGRVLTDYDLHLFGEGTHHRAFDKLGAHLTSVGVTAGVHFSVWAPNADRVSVIGDFNGWDGRVHPMRHLGPSGLWETLRSRAARWRALQVRDPRRHRCAAEEKRSVRVCLRSASAYRVDRPRYFKATSGTTTSGWRGGVSRAAASPCR